MAKQKKGAGGKLARSEIVQARLSPKLRYVAELLARSQRRTLSSLVEYLVEKEANIEHSLDDEDIYPVNLMRFVNEIWTYDEPKRLVVIGTCYPSLLSPDEEKVFRRIKNNLYFWRCHRWINYDMHNNIAEDIWQPAYAPMGIIGDHLLKYWEILNADTITPEDLPPRDEPGDVFKDDLGEPIAYTTELPIDTTNLNIHERKAFIEKYWSELESQAHKNKETEDAT